MNTTSDMATSPGTKTSTGEKIAGWLILAMVVYLVIAQ